MNDECGDVDDDEDGDGRFAWEGILGSIRTDQSSETYPIGSFQAPSSTILSSKCLLLLLLFPVVWSISGLLWIVLALPDGTVGLIKRPGQTGRSLTPLLKR